MKKCCVLIFFFIMSVDFLQAQQMLIVQNLSGDRRYEFTEGENLRLKLNDSKEVLSGNWQYSGKHTLKISSHIIALKDIQWIDVSEKEKGIWTLRKSQDLLLIAGLGYFTIAHINIPIETGVFALDKRVARASAIMLTGSLISYGLDRTLRRRKIPVNGKKFSASLVDLP